ncbi:MAG: Ig-like domain-containing protein [Oscillospiraceae bacterium]|nr:Ig-like domain-containing protein [Oscillospiraceae bacterium]
MKQTKKIVSLLLAAVMMFSLMSVCAFAEPIGENAVILSDGIKNTEGKVEKSSGTHTDYKYVVDKKGILDITINTSTSHFSVVMVDADGVEVEPLGVDFKSGKAGNNKNYYRWQDSTEKFVGTISYKVDKGTYYFRISRGTNKDGDGKLTVTATRRDDPTTKLECFNLTLKKGDKLTLGATATTKNAKLVWSSSKKTVATVSAKGVVTAKKAGTTIITCATEDGSSELQIKITVSNK